MKEINLIKLDANELAYPLTEEQMEILTSKIDFSELNRYPDADATELINAYSNFIGLSEETIIAGNGSDEVLDIIFKSFTKPRDLVVSLSPSFVMYEVMSSIFDCQFRKYQPTDYYDLNVENFIKYIDTIKPKLVFICNPNNPTGALLKPSELLEIIQSTTAMVVVDEAYGEFVSEDFEAYSVLGELSNYNNLIVLKTLSKAVGLAGLRIGFGLSQKANIDLMMSKKYPYNISKLSQTLGITLMNNGLKEIVEKNRMAIINNRLKLSEALKTFEDMTVYPSAANFIWIKVNSGWLPKSYFIETLGLEGIKIRSFPQSYLENHYRITVGTEAENKALIECIEQLYTYKKAACQ